MTILQEIDAIPELRFVVLCSCLDPDSETQALIQKMGVTSLDWDKVYETAREQRTLPLVSRNIRSIIPAKTALPIAEKLKSFSFQNTTRNLFALNLLLNIVRIFRENNISVMPFKGLLTAEDIYGDIGLRSFSDLDLLVKKNQALKAWDLLKNQGFLPEISLDMGQAEKFIQVEDNMSFQFKGNNMPVELHWEMSGYYLSEPLFFEKLETRTRNIEIHNQHFLNLSSEDLLLYLCVHGAKHGWEYLEQVCCVAEVLKQKQLDWDLIEALSRDWKCANILYTGLMLATILFKAPVPDAVNKKMLVTKKNYDISESVLGNMFKKYGVPGDEKGKERFSSFHLQIRDRAWDKSRYFFRLAFRPTKKEWQHFPVPAWLSFVHYFLRPFRLVKEGLGKHHA